MGLDMLRMDDKVGGDDDVGSCSGTVPPPHYPHCSVCNIYPQNPGYQALSPLQLVITINHNNNIATAG